MSDKIQKNEEDFNARLRFFCKEASCLLKSYIKYKKYRFYDRKVVIKKTTAIKILSINERLKNELLIKNFKIINGEI